MTVTSCQTCDGTGHDKNPLNDSGPCQVCGGTGNASPEFGLSKLRPWTDTLRAACTFRCGDYGEPACHAIVDDCEPCEECLAEVYGLVEKPEPRCPDTKELPGL